MDELNLRLIQKQQELEFFQRESREDQENLKNKLAESEKYKNTVTILLLTLATTTTVLQ